AGTGAPGRSSSAPPSIVACLARAGAAAGAGAGASDGRGPPQRPQNRASGELALPQALQTFGAPLMSRALYSGRASVSTTHAVPGTLDSLAPLVTRAIAWCKLDDVRGWGRTNAGPSGAPRYCGALRGVGPARVLQEGMG